MTMVESQRRFPDVWPAADWSDAVATETSDDDNEERLVDNERCRTPITEMYCPAGYSDMEENEGCDNN